MKLSELLSALPESSYKSSGLDQIEISLLTQDARKVELGAVFVAIPGTQRDGHDFIPEAMRAGAVALVVENAEKVPTGYTGATVLVPSAREAFDHLCKRWFHDPSSGLFCFGVTGTNGKTSTTYMLEWILKSKKIPCGVLGTVDHHLAEKVWETSLTTPDPFTLQGRLREMKNLGARAIAMEVSSHALSQKRADGVAFNTVIFTNLTQDHLDYYSSMKEYFLAKQRLFTELLWESKKPHCFAVVNTDDTWGSRLKIAGLASVWSFGQKKSADFRFKITATDFTRTDFELMTPLEKYTSYIPLCGLHNVYNAVGAIVASISSGIKIEDALEAMKTFTGVPGRLQSVTNSKSLNIFVDYAHSPDALENVLTALGKIKQNIKAHPQIWTVFGCGGDRDKGKRPLMAAITEKYSDQIIVTSDNPRTEDPLGIITDILAGFSADARKNKVQTQVDRKEAIRYVLKHAKPHDVILIAGKGHEDYQIIGTEKKHFSDIQVAHDLLQEL